MLAHGILDGATRFLPTVHFRNLSTAWTPINDHPTSQGNSTLCIRHMLVLSVCYSERLARYRTHFVLTEREWHTLAVATDLDVYGAESLEDVLDRKLQLIIGTRGHKTTGRQRICICLRNLLTSRRKHKRSVVALLARYHQTKRRQLYPRGDGRLHL